MSKKNETILKSKLEAGHVESTMNLNQARKTGQLDKFIKERQHLTGDPDAVTRVIKSSEISSTNQATSKKKPSGDCT